MIKVVIDTSPLESGHKGRGVGTYTRELVKALQKESKDIEIITSKSPYESGADLVHLPYFDLHFHTLPLTKKIPTIVTIHDVIPLRYPKEFPVGIKGTLNYWKQRLSLSSVKAVVTDSDSSKADITEYLAVPENKITTIYLAASTDFKPSTQQSIKLLVEKYSFPKKFLLFVGSINYNKNIPQLINAIAQVHKIPLIINTRTSLDSIVQEKQTRMILDAVNNELKKVSPDLVRVVTIDSVEELNSLYSAAYAYIQPSLHEGFGLPLLEAMQSGTPVVSSSHGSLAEVGGKAVYYFDPTSTQSMIDSILQIWTLSAPEYQQLIAKGKKQAQKFSWQKTAQQTLAVYQSVLENN